VAPYLTLMTQDAPQRGHDLREVFNGMRYVVRGGLACPPERSLLVTAHFHVGQPHLAREKISHHPLVVRDV
jgi:hypothetical protein